MEAGNVGRKTEQLLLLFCKHIIIEDFCSISVYIDVTVWLETSELHLPQSPP